MCFVRIQINTYIFPRSLKLTVRTPDPVLSDRRIVLVEFSESSLPKRARFSRKAAFFVLGVVLKNYRRSRIVLRALRKKSHS